jgi:hypothetical protein
MLTQYFRHAVRGSQLLFCRWFAIHGSVINHNSTHRTTLHARRSEAKPRWYLEAAIAHDLVDVAATVNCDL